MMMSSIMAPRSTGVRQWRFVVSLLCIMVPLCASFSPAFRHGDCSTITTTRVVNCRPGAVASVTHNPRQRETAMRVMSDPEEDMDEERLSDEELASTMGDWDDKIARFNTVHLVGRLGNDPEPKYFDDGKVVVNLSIACKRKLHSAERKANNIASGEEETDWYGLEIWGKTAEFVSKYVDKGARVGVVGSLQVDQWSDKATGEPRSRAKVVVRDFDILETKAEADLRRSNRRGPSFYKEDKDDDGPSSAGSGAFFD